MQSDRRRRSILWLLLSRWCPIVRSSSWNVQTVRGERRHRKWGHLPENDDDECLKENGIQVIEDNIVTDFRVNDGWVIHGGLPWTIWVTVSFKSWNQRSFGQQLRCSFVHVTKDTWRVQLACYITVGHLDGQGERAVNGSSRRWILYNQPTFVIILKIIYYLINLRNSLLN